MAVELVCQPSSAQLVEDSDTCRSFMNVYSPYSDAYLQDICCLMPLMVVNLPSYLCWRVAAATHTFITSSLTSKHEVRPANMNLRWSN